MSKFKKYTIIIIVAIAIGLIISLPTYFKNTAVIELMDSFGSAVHFESDVLTQAQLDELKQNDLSNWVEITKLEKETINKIGYLMLFDKDNVEILTVDVFALKNDIIAYGNQGQIMYPLIGEHYTK